MTGDVLRVLGGDAEKMEHATADLRDRDLVAIYEALALSRAVDEAAATLQQGGQLRFWVPFGAAAAVAVGAGRALREDDWLFPGFRDGAAFLVRGGSVEKLMAQLLGSADDMTRARQLPGRPSLPGGRYVAPSDTPGNPLLLAAGAALAMSLGGADTVAAGSCGGAAVGLSPFHTALESAARHRSPAIFLVRTRAAGAAERATACGLRTRQVDGGDVLAVFTAVAAARQAAVAGEGATLIEARLADDSADPAAALRPLLEHRGSWDPGREEELRQRCTARVGAAVEAALAVGPPPWESIFDDVYRRPAWRQQEDLELLQAERARRQRSRTAG